MARPTRRSDASARLTDEELDRFIHTRLALLGVDLSVLPEEDETAPVDRVRVLRSARAFLRRTIPALADLELDPGEVSPAPYPAALAPLLEEGREGVGER